MNRAGILGCVVALLVVVAGCAGSSRDPGEVGGTSESQTGLASYYGGQFDGRQTASGEIFDQTRLTAAHRSLPFGTMVRVTNLANGKIVNVRVNDRGPFVEGRIIDLSRRAAEELDFIREGVVKVRVEVLSGN